MKRFIPMLVIFLIPQSLFAGHRRYFHSADDINSGTLDPARVSPSTFTMQGPIVLPNESSYTITLGGYGVFPSTYLPVEGATFKVSKATWIIFGIDAWVNKPSSVAPTVFMMFYSTGGGYGINWSSMSPPIPIVPDSGAGNQARQSIYISSVMPILEGNFIGIGITTVPISGVPPSDWGVNIHTLIRRNGETW